MSEALKETYLLQMISQALPGLVWTTRADGYCDFVSMRWLEYTGLTAAQAEGWGWKSAMHEEDLKTQLQVWVDAIESGADYENEIRLYHAQSGTYRWNLIRGIALRNDQGKVEKWLGVCTDVHELKLTQAAL